MELTWLENALVAMIFLVPLSLLVLVQVQNICKNSTTNMRFSKRKNVVDDAMLDEETQKHFYNTMKIEQDEEQYDFAAYNSLLTVNGNNMMGTYTDCVVARN